MASILDAAVLVGRETTYGTPATLARAYEAHADTMKRKQEFMQSVGMRGGQQTDRSDRRTAVNMGGEGTVEVDFLTVGMGQLLQACFGTTGEAVEASTAYKQTHATATAEPGDSYTVQVQRPDVGGTVRSFTYHGCVVTGWSFKQALNDHLKLEWQFDAEDVDTSTGAGTPSYPVGSPMHWVQCGVSWGGSAIHVDEFNLSGSLGLKTDRHFLRQSALKKQPLRASTPTFDGSMKGEFEDLDVYADFVAGTERELVATWVGDEIASTGEYYTLTLTMPAVQLSGDTPTVNLSNTPKQSMPFKVLHDPSAGAAITCEYITTQDTLLVGV